MKEGKYQAIVIGVSAGGIAALEQILPVIDWRFRLPLLVVQHIGPESDNYLVDHFRECCPLKVKEADDKEIIQNATVYFAPPNYHMLIELDRTIALSADRKINYSRPSIDVLFETAAEAYCESLVGVVLTGANSDGAKGLAKIQSFGGLTIVQSPETAEVDTMPQAAIAASSVDHILPLKDIGAFLSSLNGLTCE